MENNAMLNMKIKPHVEEQQLCLSCYMIRKAGDV